MFQDNQSAMKFELNGRMSSGRKTKHMNNRTFWIKDRVKTDNIKIMYCPTRIMLPYFLSTKPLQGMLFKRFCAVIMGHQHIDWLEQFRDETTSSSKERVRLDESDKESNESKTEINDNVSITQPVKAGRHSTTIYVRRTSARGRRNSART